MSWLADRSQNADVNHTKVGDNGLGSMALPSSGAGQLSFPADLASALFPSDGSARRVHECRNGAHRKIDLARLHADHEGRGL